MWDLSPLLIIVTKRNENSSFGGWLSESDSESALSKEQSTGSPLLYFYEAHLYTWFSIKYFFRFPLILSYTFVCRCVRWSDMYLDCSNCFGYQQKVIISLYDFYTKRRRKQQSLSLLDLDIMTLLPFLFSPLRISKCDKKWK